MVRTVAYIAAVVLGAIRAKRMVTSSYGSIRRMMQSPRYTVYIQSAVVVEGCIYTAGPMYAVPVHGSHYVSPDILRLNCLRVMKQRIVTYISLDRGDYFVRVLNSRDADGDHDDVSKAGLSRTDMETVHGYELAVRKFIASHRSGFTYDAKVEALDAAKYSDCVDVVKGWYRIISRQGRKVRKW